MNQPRVLLIKPPESSAFNFGAFSLGVLAAGIRDIAVPEIMDATRETPHETARQVWSLKPDLIGITVMALGSVPPALHFLQTLVSHKNGRDTPILVGGHGAAWLPESFLKAGADAVVTGEGEAAFRSIVLKGVNPGAPGIACRSGGSMIIGSAPELIRPLDRLALPARDLMPLPADGIHLMETSRGCPHQCRFCETTRFYGKTWRPHSPERVAAETALLVDQYDAWTILLADDNFAASTDRVMEICRRLCKGPLPAVFLASIRADDLVRVPEMAAAMAEARILRVTVGVETLEPGAAVNAGKPIDQEVYQEAFALLRTYGIFSLASFITGLPGQQSDVNAAVEHAVSVGPDAAVFVPFLPMPGTPLAEGHTTFESKARDRENAEKSTAAFFQHPAVRKNLAEAELAGGIRGLMAKSIRIRHGTPQK